MRGKTLFTASTFSHIRNFHLPYIEYFHEQGWEVHIGCGGDVMSVPNADKVLTLPFQKRMSSPKNLKAAKMLRKLIQTEKYDLITTHTSLAAFFTRLAVKGMKDRPPVVNTVHGYLFDDDTPILKRNILLAAEKLTAPETDLLLTMDRYDYEFAQRYCLGKRISQIPGMGVDFSRLDDYTEEDARLLRSEWSLPEDSFVLLYPAEFSKRKSQEVLLRAMTKLPERAILVLAGSGALLERCRAKAADLRLGGRVLFPGQIGNMGPWYAMADAAVSASRSEGLPFNVMEAMHCGLPMVASAVKGHTDLIKDGKTGLLYPYGDAEACAETVRHLMSSGELRRSLGSAARACAEQYRLETVMPEVIAELTGMIPQSVISR